MAAVTEGSLAQSTVTAQRTVRREQEWKQVGSHGGGAGGLDGSPSVRATRALSAGARGANEPDGMPKREQSVRGAATVQFGYYFVRCTTGSLGGDPFVLPKGQVESAHLNEYFPACPSPCVHDYHVTLLSTRRAAAWPCLCKTARTSKAPSCSLGTGRNVVKQAHLLAELSCLLCASKSWKNTCRLQLSWQTAEQAYYPSAHTASSLPPEPPPMTTRSHSYGWSCCTVSCAAGSPFGAPFAGFVPSP